MNRNIEGIVHCKSGHSQNRHCTARLTSSWWQSSMHPIKKRPRFFARSLQIIAIAFWLAQNNSALMLSSIWKLISHTVFPLYPQIIFLPRFHNFRIKLISLSVIVNVSVNHKSVYLTFNKKQQMPQMSNRWPFRFFVVETDFRFNNFKAKNCK